MQAIYYLERGTRFSCCMSLGVIVTGMLLLLMCSLIAVEPPEITETIYTPFNISMPETDIDIRKENKPVPPPDPTDEPERQADPTFDPPPVDTKFVLIKPGPGIIKKIGTSSGSGGLVEMFPVAPVYPDRARRRAIEGYVDLVFDVTAAGRTENIRVIDANPKGYFERASIKAIAKWKYRPAMEDGLAIASKSIIRRITFELED